ncbi:hypothetical protein SAMN04488134_1196 [Amphibacillus marinus]|uniref:Tfp pilus assembly protein PilO n=1 Tax=Amphibacillus marinus TaxID=872970 RepID=A0A1H8TRS8_9BACI|nr:hypothetical protein [Amphibacillus marinus]SEO93565.1 hypothetical protein SAMN04488134_1196 [Amphibacillus marinus]
MQIKWERNYSLFLVAILAIIFAVWYYGQQHYLADKEQAFVDTEATLRRYDAIINQATSTDQSDQLLREEAIQLQRQLPTEPNVDQLITSIYEAEQETGIVIEELINRTDTLSSDQVYYPVNSNAVHVELTLKAEKKNDFELFFHLLEQGDRLLEIIELNYHSTGVETISATVTLRVFFNENVLIK